MKYFDRFLKYAWKVASHPVPDVGDKTMECLDLIKKNTATMNEILRQRNILLTACKYALSIFESIPKKCKKIIEEEVLNESINFEILTKAINGVKDQQVAMINQEWFLIDTFNPYVWVVCFEIDGSNMKIFDSYEKAVTWGQENLQSFKVFKHE